MSPTIDIAVPVYNGEAFLEQALDAILAQDFVDLRVLISDNASTDRTQEICRAYAERDERISYFRQQQNIGAAPNFNFLFAKSRAKYFKWHAADDLISPTFVSRCVEALELDDNVVLAFSKVQIIDSDRTLIRVDDPATRVHFDDRVKRFGSLVQFHRYPCFEIFGVYRRSVLEDTILIGPFSGGDRNLLAHVALRGKFAICDDELFQQRRHDNQSVQMVSDKLKYDEWFDPKNVGKTRLPEWNRYTQYAKSVIQEPIGLVDTARCIGYLARQMVVRWRHLASDIKRLITIRFTQTARG